MVQDYKGIIFITDRTDHQPLIYKSQKILVSADCNLLHQYLTLKTRAGIDSEFNRLRYHAGQILLVQIGDVNTRFVLDWTCERIRDNCTGIINFHSDRGVVWFGHNIKADLNKFKPVGIFLKKIYDTMIMNQRIHLGKSGILHNLVDVTREHCNIMRDTTKDTREDFPKMNWSSTFHIGHIMYSAEDIQYLEMIAISQRKILVSYNMWEWNNTYENQLVDGLSSAELRGIALYQDKWEPLIKEKKKEKLGYANFLDAEMSRLGAIKVPKERKQQTVFQTDLFSSTLKEITNENKRHINYDSPKQVLGLIDKIGEPLPLFKDKGKQPKPSMREPALMQYLIDNPQTKLKPFINKYLDFKEVGKFISSYGNKFYNSEIYKKNKIEQGYKNPITGFVDTSYKQCNTDTGRLASGDAKGGTYNSQNIPAKKVYREAFGLTPQEIAEGYYLTTCDWSQAELIIMAALANDQHLYEIGADKIIDGKKVEGDLHSVFATKSWRAVWTYRYNKFIDKYGIETYRTANKEKLDKYFTVFDSENKPFILTQDFVVSKTEHKQVRTDFKRMGFGVVYGLRDAKGAQTLNITKPEAQVVIDMIKLEIPRTIQMVEEAAGCALADGYVVFNARTNNRRWFSDVISYHLGLDVDDRGMRYNYTVKNLDFKTKSAVEGEARNCRIQGTQADMLKESIVEIQKVFNRYPREGLVLTVHDENVVAHKGKEMSSTVGEIMERTANKYLALYSDNIRMRSESHCGTTWTK